MNCKTYGEAIEIALNWLKRRGINDLEEAFEAKFGGFGMQTINGAAGYRLEFDERAGPHINVWCRKEKGPHISFNGNEQDVKSKCRQLFWWDPNVKRRSSQS